MSIDNDIYENLNRVQLIIYLDFSNESEKALQTAWRVANELIEENIWVDIEPIHVWVNDVIENTIDLPKIYINGKLMFIGRAPSYTELKEAILDRLGKYIDKRIEEESVIKNEFENGFREVAIDN
ncbi:MAG: hypothetical protein QXW87_03190 [Desulfurococcaceae archaeon]|uniref:Thioredoxin-like fold domain-containing protein n=1 Tax=Staphylothermus marinus TaxID=2280 RepID=A0A7C4D861_STAMA